MFRSPVLRRKLVQYGGEHSSLQHRICERVRFACLHEKSRHGNELEGSDGMNFIIQRHECNDETENRSNVNKNKLLSQSLLQSAMNRASRTILDLSNNDFESNSNNGNDQGIDLMAKVANRSNTVIVSTSNERSDLDVIENKEGGEKVIRKHEDKRQYLSNPSVTPTALAHSLWAQVVQPYADTIIDATCGNGKDTLVLARLLFPVIETGLSHHQENDANERPQLIGIDIQKQACENTMELLTKHLPPKIVEENIQVFHASHAPLPKSTLTSSVGLICYNLGYLPGSGSSNKQVSTKMITTIYSLTDAALLLRVGGLLSVMAYPGSSYLEYCSVKYFVEGLAMFSSRDDWREFVDSIPDDELLLKNSQRQNTLPIENKIEENSGDVGYNSSVRDSVRVALERLMNEGNTKQTWRAFDHRPLGRPLSPILFTAMRIK